MDEVKISDKELAQLNAEIESNKAAEKARMEKEIREKLANEQKLKEQEDTLKKMQEDLVNTKKLQEEKEAKLREEFQKQLDELKAVKQGLANVQNPFDKKIDTPKINLEDSKVLDSIEESSRQELLKRHPNLPPYWGTA